MKREDYATLGFSLVFSVIALVIGLVALTRGGPSLQPYMRASALDLSRGGANEAANTSITAALAARGLAAQKLVITHSVVDGARAIVTEDVTYGSAEGRHTRRIVITVILHRTAWSLGQLTEGPPAGAAN